MTTFDPTRLSKGKLAAKVARARSALGHGILYKLGSGGMRPSSPFPDDGTGLSDCSGFALAWVQGISREQAGKKKPWSAHLPWVNTDAVVADAKGVQELFILLDSPVPGCAVVYPAKGGQCGHCAIVTAVQYNLHGRPSALHGIDCHGGLRGHTIAAIEEHDLTYFLSKDSVFVALREDLA